MSVCFFSNREKTFVLGGNTQRWRCFVCVRPHAPPPSCAPIRLLPGGLRAVLDAARPRQADPQLPAVPESPGGRRGKEGTSVPERGKMNPPRWQTRLLLERCYCSEQPVPLDSFCLSDGERNRVFRTLLGPGRGAGPVRGGARSLRGGVGLPDAALLPVL